MGYVPCVSTLASAWLTSCPLIYYRRQALAHDLAMLYIIVILVLSWDVTSDPELCWIHSGEVVFF
jgi:hypothetical protein